MTATKSDVALVVDGYSLSAGNTGYTSTTQSLSTTYGSVLLISVTNSGTQTVGTTAQIQAVDVAGNLYAYGGALTASLTSGATTSWIVPISICVTSLNVLFVGATGNTSTLRCHILTCTKI